MNFKVGKTERKSTKRSLKIKNNEPVKRIDIPKEFLKKIKKLGLNEEDAEILYRTKIDWKAMYSENKIYCVEPGCSYFTKLDTEELSNHMKNVHNYGEYPCDYPHCSFIGVSKKNLNLHARMHMMRSDKEFWYKCPRPGCQSSFDRENHLNMHLRIHNNDLRVVSF